MTIYILKTICCPALFLSIYFLLLEREKMHVFNRWFLLTGLVFSFAIPLFSIHMAAAAVQVPERIGHISIGALRLNPSGKTVISTGRTLFINLAWAVYIAVTLLQAIRFVGNILAFRAMIKKSKSVLFEGVTLVLVQEVVVPYSFWQYIFLNREQFENGAIETEVLCHEAAHVKQRHSIDVLLVEVLLVFAWFNPFLYVYRKAMQLNHEFLADDRVIGAYRNIPGYQDLLLSKAKLPGALSLSSRFDYSMTKKRLIMMTKQTSRKAALLRGMAVLVFLAVAGCIFIGKAAAQDKGHAPDKEQHPIPSTMAGVSQEILSEYAGIVARYKTTGKEWRRKFLENITETDRERMLTIFKQMSREQQEEQIVGFMAPPLPLPKRSPSKEQLKSWEDSTVYGVWINEQKVKNRELAGFAPISFDQVFVSKLSRNAVNYGKYYYEVDLMTRDYYEKYYRRAIQDTLSPVVFRR
jgi:bla regulator protein BlaR1